MSGRFSGLPAGSSVRWPLPGAAASLSHIVGPRDVELIDALAEPNGLSVPGAGSLGPSAAAIGVAVLAQTVFVSDLFPAGAVLRELQLRFLGPIRLSDVVTATATVKTIDDTAETVELDMRLHRDDGAEVVTGSAVYGLQP